ncbi:MAG: HD-GYP domain-containing protein [Lachnospiraceae bacterium]|nr:HD-GYP domain-containing protein [Lachnospiraceae bacterium]
MPKLLIHELIPGMVTAEDVFSFNNQLIVPKDMVLTDKAITKMEFYSIMAVNIKESSLHPDTPEPIPEPSYSEKIRSSAKYKQFRREYEEEMESFKDSVNDLITLNVMDTEALLKKPEKLLEESESGIHIFDMLHNMRMYDDPTYAHCMNVALICNVFGSWIKMDEEDIKTLTLCGLLHDIGKIMIPDTIITKPAKLTPEEYSVIKTHSLEGYNAIKRLNIDDHIKNAALMHHERCDGSGYPFGLKTNRIDRFARIVSIADVYDAMTSARVYRGPLCPFQVISIFEQEGLQKYDPEYILIFLGYIVNTYMHNRVRLSNGMEGDIVLINKMDLSKPMIQCGNHYIDLSREHGLYVEAIL